MGGEENPDSTENPEGDNPEDSGEDPIPEPDPTPDPDPETEYVLDIELAAATRLPSEEFDVTENAFALRFVDDAENHVLQILITGSEGEVVLQDGEYDIEDSLLKILDSETELEFETGKAVITLAEEAYTFDITLTNENGAYHFIYDGVVVDMEPEPEPPIIMEPDYYALIFIIKL